jgi:hypothetical protein
MDDKDNGHCHENITTTQSVRAYDWSTDIYEDNDHINIDCWRLDRNQKPYLILLTHFLSCYQAELLEQ